FDVLRLPGKPIAPSCHRNASLLRRGVIVGSEKLPRDSSERGSSSRTHFDVGIVQGVNEWLGSALTAHESQETRRRLASRIVAVGQALQYRVPGVQYFLIFPRIGTAPELGEPFRLRRLVTKPLS